MSLILTIVKSPEGVSLPETSRTFGEEGGSIGRGSNNQWILQDPDRFLSSRHCEVSFSGGQYFITDLSTNGTFVNGSPEPLGKGSQMPLADGDTFELGDYSFEASVDSAGASMSQGMGSSSPFGDSPFGGIASDDSLFGTPPASDPGPFGSSGLNFEDSLSLNPEPEVSDPLAALDNAYKNQSDPFGGGVSSDSGFGSDPFGSGSASSSGFTADPFATPPSANPASPFGSQPSPNSYGDGSDPLSQNVNWPSSAEQNLIPEGWDDDLMGGSSDNSPFGGPDISSEPTDFSVPTPDPLQAAPPVAPVPTPTPPPKPVSAPKPRPAPAEPVVDAEPQKPRPARQSPAASPKPGGSAEAKKAEMRKNAIQSIKAGNAFIDAMGLDSSGLSNEQVLEISQLAGELMREVVEGMMQLLRSRTSIKNEFRMNVTTIQPVENNPLKFSVNVEEALENMFVKKSSAYKEPVEAFKEGFQGVAEHQIAIIAGIRYAFESMIERFNPENLEKMFDKGGKAAVIPAMQKAKYWAAYHEHYKNLMDNMEHSFQHLFGDDFVQAYEDQLRRLMAERKNKN